VGVGEGEGEFQCIDSKHHTTRFEPCLRVHHQVCFESEDATLQVTHTYLEGEGEGVGVGETS
jgi:hypothetical protein